MSSSKVKKKITVLIFVLLCGCVPREIVLQQHNLAAIRKMSPVYLRAGTPDRTTVYIDIHNNTDPYFNIKPALKIALKTKGYRIVRNPNNAFYRIQGEIVKLNALNVTKKTTVFGSFSAVLAKTSAAIGILNATSTVVETRGIKGGFIQQSAITLPIHYTLLTELHICYLDCRIQLQQRFNEYIVNGDVALLQRVFSCTEDYKSQHLRIVSKTSKANAGFNEARFALKRSLVRSIAGLF